MNQTPIKIDTSPTQTNPQSISKIKTIIIYSIIGLIVILGSIWGIKLLNQKMLQTRDTKDQIVIKKIFDLRTQATKYYEINQSYKNWQPSDAAILDIQSLGSALIFRKPDYQSYIMYAYITSDKRFFCIDTTGFAEEIDQISDTQVKCN